MPETTKQDSKWTGSINPGSPVACEKCGAWYVPVSYELAPQPCPRCGT